MARSSSRLRYLGLMLVLSTAVLIGASLVAQPSGNPDIQVLNGTTVIPLNGSVAFAATPVGVANSITFTVKNSGTDNLLVSEAISVPQGFTLMATFPGVPNANFADNTPAYTIAPNATATFTVALNSAAAGNYSGLISLTNNVTGKNPFVFTVTGEVLPPPAVRYVDDGGAGFTSTSGFTANFTRAGDSGRAPFQGSLSYAPAGTGTQTGTWTFTGLEPGQYKVSATWPGYSVVNGASVATNTTYTINDGTTAVGTAQVNQQSDSTGFNDGGAVWQDLGVFTIIGPTLAVKISDNANGTVLADGMRLERVGYPGGIMDDAGPGFSLPMGTWQRNLAATDFQGGRTTTNATTTPGTPTATAQWSFTVVPGTYRVLAGYNGYAGAATNAPYSVFDGTTNLTPTPVQVNQSATPTDLVDTIPGWKDLGFFAVTSTTLNVLLTNDANGPVNADAVRIELVNIPTVRSTADTVRFLEQASWGPTPDLIAQVQSTGFETWLNQQFDPSIATGYPTLPLYRTGNNVANDNIDSCYGDPTVAGNPARTACLRDHYSQYPNQTQFFFNALYGPDQLRQRVTWVLHKIWVVSGVDLTQPAWVAPYLQILSAPEDGTGVGTFGNYRNLMYQITLNPAMGKYLSMAGSRKASATSQPNENYPRELMQLFTIGLSELNPNGQQKTDGGGNPIPTYDQTLVDNMSKVFTGWNFSPAPSTGVPNYIDPMRLNGTLNENPQYHDFTSKPLLRGFVQPARTPTTGAAGVANAYTDLNEGLDNIYNHPNVGPFVAKHFIQQLVTAGPSPAYIARVSDTFSRNRTNPNQLREVVKAVLLDPEARGDRKNASNYGHLKEPVLYMNNVLRMFGALSADQTQLSDGYLNPGNYFAVTQGQDVFRPPSVFSYFAPGKGEFQILTTSTTLARIDFVNQCSQPNSGRAIDVVRNPGTNPNGTDPFGNPIVPTGPLGTSVDLSFLLPYADGNPTTAGGALADQLNTLMLHGIMTPEMKADIVTAVVAVTSSSTPTLAQQRKRVRYAVYLVATSSQYQVQR
jgi:uncharacterized protein (DUF1800 family)